MKKLKRQKKTNYQKGKVENLVTAFHSFSLVASEGEKSPVFFLFIYLLPALSGSI